MAESYAHDIAAAASHGKVLDENEHRPWPLPDAPWIMGQSWERLLFAHWRVPLDQLREVVHPKIPIDTFDGDAWVGITPFTVTGFHVRGTPPPPGVSSFHEINVRTYATIDGRPGIYFLSLDAESRLAVETARRIYRLPYFESNFEVQESDGRVRYDSERSQGDGPPAGFAAEYEPIEGPFHAQPGSFDHWCSERYCLYTLDDEQTVLRGEIHHPPWPLQRASATIARNTMTQPHGLTLDGEPTLHLARRQDVVFWPNRPA